MFLDTHTVSVKMIQIHPLFEFVYDILGHIDIYCFVTLKPLLVVIEEQIKNTPDMIQIGMGDEDGVQLFIRYAGTVGQQQDRRWDVVSYEYPSLIAPFYRLKRFDERIFLPFGARFSEQVLHLHMKTVILSNAPVPNSLIFISVHFISIISIQTKVLPFPFDLRWIHCSYRIRCGD